MRKFLSRFSYALLCLGAPIVLIKLWNFFTAPIHLITPIPNFHRDTEIETIALIPYDYTYGFYINIHSENKSLRANPIARELGGPYQISSDNKMIINNGTGIPISLKIVSFDPYVKQKSEVIVDQLYEHEPLLMSGDGNNYLFITYADLHKGRNDITLRILAQIDKLEEKEATLEVFATPHQ